METNSKLETPIGTREAKKLEAREVKVIGVDVDMQKNSMGQQIGEKVTLSCQHPDKAEPIQISSVSFVKNKQIKSSGIWYKLDEDGQIGKDSALSILLRAYGATNLKQLIGKELQTEADPKGYLCVKAY